MNMSCFGRIAPTGLAAFLAACLGACVSNPVSVAGNGSQAEFIAKDWAPKTREALQDFETYARTTLGIKPVLPTVILASSTDEAKKLEQAKTDKLVIRANSAFPSTLSERTIIRPVHEAMLASLQARAGGRTDTPVWLREGLAWQTAYFINDTMHNAALSSEDWREDVRADLHKAKDLPALSEMFGGTADKISSDTQDAVSIFLVTQLQSFTGARFQSAWLAYFSTAATPAFEPDSAFEHAFGISLKSFLDQAQTQLTTLRAEALNHADPAQVAALKTAAAQRTPPELPTQRLKEAFARYSKEPVPKAFAMSRSGIWTYLSATPHATERALRDCNSAETRACNLYAIDDDIVLDASHAGNIDVIMFGDASDGWAKTVSEHWVPVIRKSADGFKQAIQQKFDVRLPEDTHIYVVADKANYLRLLRDEIHQSSRFAEMTSESSDGFANSRGQLVTGMFANYPESYRWALATSTTLHELAHEMQAQLSNGYAGFYPPRWIIEGSADQIAYFIGKDIPRDADAKYEIDNWREDCLDWYRLAGFRSTRPADVLTPDYPQWIALINSDKRPYQMSGLMVAHLEDLLGDKYYPALISYFRHAADKDLKESDAFKESFGMTQEAFLASLEKWLASLLVDAPAPKTPSAH